MVVEINGKIANIPDGYAKSVSEKKFVAAMQAHEGWTSEELSKVYQAITGIGGKQKAESGKQEANNE
jgi:hypothetical protein